MTMGRMLVALVLAGAACLSTLVLVESGFGETADRPGSIDADSANEPNDIGATDPARRPGRSPDWSAESTEDLHRHCPGFGEPVAQRGVRGAFTTQCEARLDQRFLDEVPPLMPFTAEDNTLTWRHVFHDPLGKRQLVLDTLTDPVCQPAVDGEIRHDLHARCHADAVADYAVLKYKCASGLFRIGSRIASGIGDAALFNPSDPPRDMDEYWRQRWAVENGYFRHAWMAAKCAGIPEAALASLGAIPNAMEFGGKPAPGEEHWWWAEQGFEAYQLMGVADRLASHLSRTEYGYEPAEISVWQRVQPVMAEVLKVKDPGRYQSSADEKIARLKHALVTSQWAWIRQTDIDDTWLYGQVGEFTEEEKARATKAAEAMMAKQRASSYRL